MGHSGKIIILKLVAFWEDDKEVGKVVQPVNLVEGNDYKNYDLTENIWGKSH